MHSLRFDRPGVVTLAKVPEPEPPPGWARIRVKAAAICMTDFEVLRGTIFAEYPITPGHEWSGVVDAVGSRTDEQWLGRRVTGDNEVTCRACQYCRRGEWRRCPEYRQIGFAAPGAYAEALLAPVPNLIQLPDSISFEQGALVEPVGVGLAVAHMADVHVGTTAVVLGTGPIGLNCLAAIIASGAIRVLCLNRRQARLVLAKAWGAHEVTNDTLRLSRLAQELHPEGTDVVIEATGNREMLGFGASLTRFGGTFVLGGYFGGGETSFRPDAVHERNVRLLGAGNNAGFNRVAALVAGEGLVRTESMITHRFGLDDYQVVFCSDLVHSPEFIKAVFLF